MHYQPHNYQTTATQYIIDHDEAAIFLGMGLGKSVITLTAIWQLMLDYFTIHRVLVVAPLRVARDTWPAEVAKWDHLEGLTVAVAVGTKRDRLNALAASAMVTVINRENIPWLVNQLGGSWPFDMVIIDELSSFKNHRAKRFTALVKMRPHVKRWVGLTGTPAANGLMDVWAQFRLLDGGQRLGRFITRYRERWFVPDKRNGMQVFTYKPRAGAEDEIYGAIGDMTLSMRTTDHLQLPELTVTTMPVVLEPKERRVYEQLKSDLVLDLDGATIDAANAAALSGKLLQLASGAIYTSDGQWTAAHDRKLDALEDLVEAANGSPLLAAYWFTHDRERITACFPQARELKTSAEIEAWNKGEITLGLIHPASAGHGLNLQSGGHLLVWFSLTWSLELYQQTNARLYRQGQLEPVTITHLVAEGTLDEAVLKALDTKDATQAALIDAVAQEIQTTTERTRSCM
ncbi:ATP-dependent helicase [Corynebacterium diphtheriae]|nr:ATP-dependent helicase [Corynebacterium diphtheriae]CAB1012161.1 ATP-dependent helicase [Corynebacterium diphtheriae]CAB1024800.1 ATP-dependent helicase [Corynebacterium diphtheriae]